jgi:hypothetical protein
MKLSTPQHSSGNFLGINGKNPSVSKFNLLHGVIFWLFLYYFEVYSLDSFKTMGELPEVSNFNLLFVKLNMFICKL